MPFPARCRFGPGAGTQALAAHRALVASVPLACLLLSSSAWAQTVRQDFDMTNGPVHAIAVQGNTLYIGGEFTRVGPPTGASASISKSAGRPIHVQHIRGEVFAVVPDGSGGWFIGGDFRWVGDEERMSLVHVLSDGSLSPMITESAEVYALAVSGTTLYLGGHFSELLGQTRWHIAAIHIPTETLLPWNPNVGLVHSNHVQAIAVHDGVVYAGGDFGIFGGSVRNNAVAIDVTSGQILGWNPDANAPVRAVSVAGDIVYLGGAFTTVGGQPHRGIAATHRNGGVVDWDPQADGDVRSILVHGSTVLAGGLFGAIGGQTRAGIAALDATTALATDWDAELGATECCPQVHAMALNGSTLYLGGKFSTIGAEPRSHLGAVDLASAVPTEWDPGAEDMVFTLASGNDVVYAGGVFRSVGGVRRTRLAAIDIPSGRVTDWNPGANQVVRALAVDGPILYAGGSFDTIGGARRKGIAALDAVTALPTAWNPRAEGSVRAIAVGPSAVYVGGSFSQISLQPRAYLAALSPTTGEALPWDPELDGPVRALALDGPALYAGGDFMHAGGVARPLVVSLDAATSDVLAWQANPSGPTNPQIYALGVSGSSVFAGGDYAAIGGQPRRNIAAIHEETGTATPWDSGVNATVYALAIDEGHVYYGGRFGFLAREAGESPGAGWGVATELWCCGLGTGYGLGTVQALGAQGRHVFVGGTYNRIGPLWRSGISLVENEDIATPTLLTLFQAEAAETGITLRWRFADGDVAERTWIERAARPEGPWIRLDLTIRYVAGTSEATDGSVDPGATWFYRIGSERAGETSWFGPISAMAQATTGRPMLELVAPNPTPDQARIEFIVSRTSHVRLSVSDLQGRVVARLVDGVERPGRRRVTWSGEDTRGKVRSGVYFVTYEAEGERHSRRLVIAK